jgi:hypothetical protein
VFGFKSNKPRERFYLLPGQGGRNYHRKQRVFLSWAVLVALLFGLVIALVMWSQARAQP